MPAVRAIRIVRPAATSPFGAGVYFATMSPTKIPAEIFTHDGARRAEFDASGWFSTAPSDLIENLARSAWRVDCRADDLEQYAVATYDDVADVLHYVMYLRHGGLAGERSYRIDGAAAIRWLATHRPEILAAVQRDGGAGRRKSTPSGTPTIKTNGKRKMRSPEAA